MNNATGLNSALHWSYNHPFSSLQLKTLLQHTATVNSHLNCNGSHAYPLTTQPRCVCAIPKDYKVIDKSSFLFFPNWRTNWVKQSLKKNKNKRQNKATFDSHVWLIKIPLPRIYRVSPFSLCFKILSFPNFQPL